MAKGEKSAREGAENLERIRQYLIDNPFCRPGDVVKATGLHKVTVSRHMRHLRKEAMAARESAE